MRTYLFETIASPRTPKNWGSFMVCVPDEIEWAWQSHVSTSLMPALAEFGWTPEHVIVMDMKTGEAAFFRPGDREAAEDLTLHRIYRSPQLGLFLTWLYGQDIAHLYQQPAVIEVEDCTFALEGWREIGPGPVSLTLRKGEVIQLWFGGQPNFVMVDDITEAGAVIRSLNDEEKAELLAGTEEAEALLAAGPDLDAITGDLAAISAPESDDTQVIPAVTDEAATQGIDVHEP